MKIVMEQPATGEEDQIIVRCRNMAPKIMRLLHHIQTQNFVLTGYASDTIYNVPLSNVFYIETVNGKTFLYGKRDVYEAKQKLYELEENLETRGFLRVSKSIILNLSKIKTLVPALSLRVEAVLENDERVIVSRRYAGEFKKRLEIDRLANKKQVLI